MSPSIPQELIEQLRKGNVVLFCGAGISVSKGGLPSGRQLAQELAERAGEPELANAPLPGAAQAYELKLGLHSLIAYVADRIDDPRYTPLRTHHLIAALPFTRIITTNWDNLLEKALDQAGKPFLKVVRDPHVAYADEAKVLLVKLHGSVEQKDSIIITGDDYYDVFARLPETANLVRTFFATKTILFLGFGLADDDFKRSYHKVTRHIGVHKRRAYAVQLDPDELTVKYWEKKNVQIIAADATAFLEALADALGQDITHVAPPPEPIPGRDQIHLEGHTEGIATGEGAEARQHFDVTLAPKGESKHLLTRMKDIEDHLAKDLALLKGWEDELRLAIGPREKARCTEEIRALWEDIAARQQELHTVEAQLRQLNEAFKAEAQKQKRLAELYGQGMACFRNGDWAETIRLFQLVLEIDQDYKDASQRLLQAKKQERLEQLYSEAKQAEAHEDWQVVIAKCHEIIDIAPYYRDVQQLLWKARFHSMGQRVGAIWAHHKSTISTLAIVLMVVGIIVVALGKLILSMWPPTLTPLTPPPASVEVFLITRRESPTITVKPDTTITATVGEIVTITVEVSTTGQEQEENLVFTWDTCRTGSDPVLETVGNPQMFYVAPSEPGSDCICIAVEKGGVRLDKERIFVDVKQK